MPRFYFNLIVPDDRLIDWEGIELTDLRAVTREALRTMREMLAEDIRCGTVDMAMRLEVVDDTRTIIHSLSCATILNNGNPLPAPSI